MRTAKSRFGETPGLALHADINVVECSLQEFDNELWLDSLPRPNTVFVCYDASREETAANVAELISGSARKQSEITDLPFRRFAFETYTISNCRV